MGDITSVNGVCLCIPERFAANESGYQQRVELHEREAVCFQEQLQILPIVTGSLKPYLFVSRQTVEPLLQQGKALAVISERPRGLDGVTNLVYNGAVVLELGNVDSYKVHGFLLFLSALLFPHLTCPCTHANSNVKR